MIINKKLIKSIADCCESPGEFITAIMALKGLNCEDVSKIKGCTPIYITQIKHNLVGMSAKICLELSEIFDIDPYILGRLNSDYKLRKLIEKGKEE